MGRWRYVERVELARPFADRDGHFAVLLADVCRMPWTGWLATCRTCPAQIALGVRCTANARRTTYLHRRPWLDVMVHNQTGNRRRTEVRDDYENENDGRLRRKRLENR